MKFQFLLYMLVLLVLSSCAKGKYKKNRNLTIAFYNVENLFDVENDSHKNDNEFTPDGSKKWTDKRYQTKLDTLARVLSSINKNELPEIIGLCEIENKKVLDDLVLSGGLAKGKYKTVHYDSPDIRGIDCALIYRPKEFKVLISFPISVIYNGKTKSSTRDILYVKGETKNHEEFHIYVNHWPSRIGGKQQTESKRLSASNILKSNIDSVLNKNPGANIIVVGDMNDEPSDKSLQIILGAKNPLDPNAQFINLMYPVQKAEQGSYNYRGNWDMLDNIVVSRNLLDDTGYKCVEAKGEVFREPWMEYKNSNGQASPSRTYGGSNYYGGMSDHFPVYFQLKR